MIIVCLNPKPNHAKNIRSSSSSIKKAWNAPLLAPFLRGIFEVPLNKGGNRGLSSNITGIT